MRSALAALSMAARPAVRLAGGEWAGWCCTYGASGSLRRVDEKYLSSTALEWGQVPAGFEECATESWEGDSLARRSVRLLPESGCAVDNLAAEVSRATLKLGVGPSSPAALAFEVEASAGVWRCETLFGGLGGARPRERRGALECAHERTRVALAFDAQRGALAAEPVVVHQERRWSETPSLQVREDRGARSGLDAAWVSSAVGLSCFGEDEAAAAGRPAAEPGPPLLLALPGGVEVRGEAGVLEVALVDAGGGAVVLRRTWTDGRVSSEVV